MKKALFLFGFMFLHLICYSQDITYVTTTGSSVSGSTSLPPWYQNLQKYWYYRYKLVNDFMIIGSNAGESLKIEELTSYAIQQQKEIDALKKLIQEMSKK